MKRLDFSEFHDLMHPLWKCYGHYGGWRRHVELAWPYVWKPRWKRRTKCRLGLHEPQTWFRHVDGATRAVQVSCANCSCELPDVIPDSPETMPEWNFE
jgi:hypothetical protein